MFTPRVGGRRAVGASCLFAIATITLLVTAGAAVSLPHQPGGVTDQLERATAALLAEAGLAPDASPPVQSAGSALKGMFTITAGSCSGATSGSFFRMMDPGGGMVQNADSPCRDETYTPLSPGSDGGLSTLDYQSHPSPRFDARGNGLAAKITRPQSFFGTNFSTATNATDPQTGTAAPVPEVKNADGKLSGNLAAFAAGWQAQDFNQGSPKPDGTTPGKTGGPTGTYDAATGAYTLDWSSTIVGGPFNNFTGQWHFEGTFKRAAGASADEPAPAPEPDESIVPLPLPLGAAPSRGAAPGPAAAPAPAPVVAAQAGGEELKGLFRILPASCASAGAESGSYFRMIQKGATADSKTYVSNTSTNCADRTFTDLAPGTDGGISTVAYQPHPNPPFKMSGSGLAEGANDKITLPKGFFGSNFSTATNETDPQTSNGTVLPTIVNDGGTLSGDMRAFAAGYQGQHFNQGSPKPDGSRPGLTQDLGGTYDATSRQFTIEWASTIVGGPFDGFTGVWHFEGTFEPDEVAAPPAPTPGAPAGGSNPTSPAPATNPGGGEVTANEVSGVPLARTGPAFPAGAGAAAIGLALLGRRATRRTRPGNG